MYTKFIVTLQFLQRQSASLIQTVGDNFFSIVCEKNNVFITYYLVTTLNFVESVNFVERVDRIVGRKRKTIKHV